MTTDTLLRIHNIGNKAALFCGCKNWVIKRDAQKLKAAKMRFPRPLLGFARLQDWTAREILTFVIT
jgi:hypothetical protein